jgi:hypothetical protein
MERTTEGSIMLSLRHLSFAAGIVMLASGTPALAQTPEGASKADAERAVQAYLALWSSDQGINADSVARFYAPRVIYYGKKFSRAQVLADKQAYIRQWPVRLYREVPGSFTARCNPDRSLCKIAIDMTWRRESIRHTVSVGRAHVGFDFVAVEGGRKIARETARIL